MVMLSSYSGTVLVGLSAAAFLAGFVDSIAGGGGIINIPALMLAGLPPHEVLGTNKLAGTFGTLNAGRVFWKKQILKPHAWWPGILMMFVGSIMGVLTTFLVSPDYLKKMLPWLILLVAAYFASPYSVRKTQGRAITQPSFIKTGILGLVMGFYDGFFGPGTGAILTALGMVLFHLPIMKSMAMARFFNASSNIAGVIVFALFGKVYFVIGLCMALANVLGGQLGAHSAVKWGTQFIRYFFIVIVLGVVIRLLMTS
ncbi:MAG: TSUP family transporter [Gammaproteobacteria bacterium]|nr:TSUP family transporter [Gammaproteobacteria bacterium]